MAQQPDDRTLFGGPSETSACAAPAQLVVIAGGRIGQVAQVSVPELAIGRERGNDLVLEAPGVSRRHAVIARQPASYTVEDLGSRNGVVLNGRRLASGERADIKHGDVLALSEVRLLFLQCGQAQLERLATIRLDQTRIGREADELVQRYLAEIGGAGAG